MRANDDDIWRHVAPPQTAIGTSVNWYLTVCTYTIRRE